MEVAENSTYFEEGKPFVAESIVSGYLTFRNHETDAGVALSSSDAQEIIALLATTKVRKTNKTFKVDRSQGEYMLSLDNNGYTMSYDVKISLFFQKDKDSNEVFIMADFSESNYLTEDLSIYNKLVEMLEKASS